MEKYEEHKSSIYIEAKGNRIKKTSGSTGIPFSVVQDKNKTNRNTAASLFLESQGGYRLGDRQAFIRVWSKSYNKSRLGFWMENLIPMDSSVLDEENIKKILYVLKKKKIKSVMGYAQTLTAISKYVDCKTIDTSGFYLKSIFPISEHMMPEVRERLAEQFHCFVGSTYSNEENGIMALQVERGAGAYQLESSTWYYELLKLDSDEPADEGELGRIVITDLYGRRVELIFDPSGNPVSQLMLGNWMTDFKNIAQWRFVQLDTDQYVFLIKAEGTVDEILLKDMFRDIFGDNIPVEYVDEIPPLPSGKRRLVENCMLLRS